MNLSPCLKHGALNKELDMSEFLTWEEKVIEQVELGLEATRSDAQSIIDAQNLILRKGWDAGDSPENVANEIIKASLVS